MARTLDQFIAFTTDSVGIERILRLVQALAQVFASCALPYELLLTLIAAWTGRAASPELTLAILISLKQRFNLTRRFFRVFRFVESFRDAQTLYSAAGRRQGEKPGATPVGADVWLDILGKTFNGMYLLLEASTTIDVLDIEGLAVWDRPTRTSISIEAQRFWLFSLVCGMLSGLWRMSCLMAYAPVPHNVAVGDAADSTASASSQETEKSTELVKDEKAVLKEEQARLRKASADRQAHARETQVQIYKLGRGALACAFDITIPGALVGWLNLDEGTVGLAMVISTLLTGMAVWEKCGEKL